MQCPGCGSVDLEPTALCGCCGLQLSVRQERELRAQMPVPARAPVVVDEYAEANVEEAA